MKNIVVAVRGKRLVFTGDELIVNDCGTPKVLIVKDKKRTPKESTVFLDPASGSRIEEITLAVFKHWDYWYEVNDQCKVSKTKILLRPKRPYPSKGFIALWNTLKTKDIVAIPSGFEVIMVDADDIQIA